MINTQRSVNRNWGIGATVKIGFLYFKVTGIAVVRDGLPDIYSLTNLDGTKRYQFIPHNGLTMTN